MGFSTWLTILHLYFTCSWSTVLLSYKPRFYCPGGYTLSFVPDSGRIRRCEGGRDGRCKFSERSESTLGLPTSVGNGQDFSLSANCKPTSRSMPFLVRRVTCIIDVVTFWLKIQNNLKSFSIQVNSYPQRSVRRSIPKFVKLVVKRMMHLKSPTYYSVLTMRFM